MSDMRRDQGTDGDEGDEPTTGAPAGAVAASQADFSAQASPDPTPSGTTPSAAASMPGSADPVPPGSAGTVPPGSADTAPPGSAGTAAPGSAAAGIPGGATPPPGPAGHTAGRSTGWRTRAARLAPAAPDGDARMKRRRRWFIGGLAAGAVLVVLTLCAGGFIVVSAFISDGRHDVDEVRQDDRLRNTACLELEQRLNRLIPPGATTTPQARALAIRDENAATRIYVSRLQGERAGDGWRQVLDARTAYAEALDAQAKSRTPAFYVAPRTGDGRAVTDELDRFSPAECAGPIRRLAAPDL
ncbi:hypothetical protein [Actinoplanes sp. NPDC049681]|uniref:hypothetical protein n=1 Tax=Actinoplanes sp. NPDC049681 TaxID=3363905 RepID=UPI00379649C9